jgi:hypothetical protein
LSNIARRSNQEAINMARKPHPSNDFTNSLSFNINAAMAKEVELFGTDGVPGLEGSAYILIFLSSRKHPVTKRPVYANDYGFKAWPFKIKDPATFRPEYAKVALQKLQVR